jgi:exosome complex RNA-binding protein Rrp42 (RNase PH superfamily)
MNEALFQRIFPHEYIMRHINNGERVDGRGENESREIKIQKSSFNSLRKVV